MSRKGIAIFLAAAILAGGLGAFLLYKPKTKSDNQQITVAEAGEFVLYLPLYVAQEKGFFKDQGLNVKITSTGGDDKTFAAVLSGDAQFGVADPTFVAIARAKGQDGKVIASVVNGVPFWGITFKREVPEITDPKNLDGFTVATFPAPSTAYALQTEMFKKAGLKPHIRQAAFGTLLATLEAEQADIALELEPNVSTAIKKGARIVYSMPKMYGDFAITGVTVSNNLATENPNLVKRFVLALDLAEEYTHKYPEDAIKVAIDRFPSINKEVLRDAVNRSLNAGVIPKTATISDKAWIAAVNLRVETGDIKSMDEAKDALDMTFAQKAEEEAKTLELEQR